MENEIHVRKYRGYGVVTRHPPGLCIGVTVSLHINIGVTVSLHVTHRVYIGVTVSLHVTPWVYIGVTVSLHVTHRVLHGLHRYYVLSHLCFDNDQSLFI